ncbi:GNAT family N-acetyltransferase [Roseimaritima ulvae]|uniref:Acetyltransferase n=1 Tax=Roseimaritima ulvae TaxID=980254 RepID=A0A5B9QQ52_9BACT|nr:GNAT family N-acetyltransferase [Roseimaritima ulvae]QEG39790.1 acetyltransferase [Roseimaritima ulvae]
MNDPHGPPTTGLDMPLYREATRQDADQIAALMEPDVRARKLLRRTPEEIAELTKHGFVAQRGETLIGFCAVEIYSRKMAEIQCLVVDANCRAQGIGRCLVRMSVERARDLGVMEVMAISSSEDFLRGCGFDYSLPDQKRAMFCQLRPRHDPADDE